MGSMTPDDIRNVAIVGHKGSGKTSLLEALLFVAKATPRLGKGEDRASGLDETAEEKAHAATLEARVVQLRWGGKKVSAIDTPGESSFQADTRLALSVADAAIVVVSAKDGVQPGTDRVFRWAQEARLPVIVALTRIDDEFARTSEIVAEIRKKFQTPLAVMTMPVDPGPTSTGVVAVRTQRAWMSPSEGPSSRPSEIPPAAKSQVDKARAQLVEDVASTDDALAERYLTEGDLTQEGLDTGLRAALAKGSIVPVYALSSTLPSGVAALLDGIVDLVPPPDKHPIWRGMAPVEGGTEAERKPISDAPLSVFVFKTHIDPHAGRTSYARVLSGVLTPDSQVWNATRGDRDRVGNLLQGTAKEMKPIQEAIAGDIVALPKLKLTRTGETISDEKNPFIANRPGLAPPLFSRIVQTEGKGTEDKVATALQRLTEEDPGLSYGHDELSRALVINGYGALHLEITVERIRRRAGIDCRLGPPRIPYRETIAKKVTNVEGKQKKQTGGHGQFGVCFIDVEPLPRGSGFVFEDGIVGGVIPRQFIPSVEKGVARAMSRGIVAGFPVVDLKVRLFDGKTHAVDSSDAAFQVAGYRAFKAAAAAAGPVILEPVMKLQVTVPGEAMGDVIGDLNSRHGKVLGTDSVAGDTLIDAFVPLSQLLDYEPKLKGMTRGSGSFTMQFDHYAPCPPMVQDKVIKESGFKQEADED